MNLRLTWKKPLLKLQWYHVCHIIQQLILYVVDCYQELVNVARDKMKSRQSLSPSKHSRHGLLTTAVSVVDNRYDLTLIV